VIPDDRNSQYGYGYNSKLKDDFYAIEEYLDDLRDLSKKRPL
jgi:hypothetical protein